MRSRQLGYIALVCIAIVTLMVVRRRFKERDINNCNKSDDTDVFAQVSINIPLRSFVEHDFLTGEVFDFHIYDPWRPLPSNSSDCRMDNCFDFTKCLYDFKVYVYPVDESIRVSDSYQKILNAIKTSPFITSNPEEACLFVTGIDTLDNDKLSSDYVSNLEELLANLPYWNDGRNHLIFNIYSGTWPDYSEKMDFNIGYAMLAKASISTTIFRTGYDISLPLFNKTLPETVGENGLLSNLNIPSTRQYLLAFKGKRYLTGIGSDSRNKLYHLHNGKDIIMLTTCKHGKDWEKYSDDRCSVDNELYDIPTYDYQTLLVNSTFCLVPRGRRLGSYRFLEVLQYGCIPVLLSDNWELPFSEIIDWKQAAVWANEDLLYQVPHSVRSLPHSKITSLQQQSQHLWTKYFSSIQTIVLTTLQIVKDRIQPHNAMSFAAYNTHPGPKYLPAAYSRDLQAFPFFIRPSSLMKFTVILYVSYRSKSLKSTLQNISAAEYVKSVFMFSVSQPDLLSYMLSVSQSATSNIPVHVFNVNSISESFEFYSKFPTDVVLFINQRNTVLTKELDFVFSVWKEYPERIVGHIARSHLWNEGQLRYFYTSRIANQYSMVLLDHAVIHKFYLYKAVEYAIGWSDFDNCYDLLINFLVADITRLPPIKVGQRMCYTESTLDHSKQENFRIKAVCMNYLRELFGVIPLRHSHVRFDPALYKDNVSKLRKKYIDLETTSSTVC